MFSKVTWIKIGAYLVILALLAPVWYAFLAIISICIALLGIGGWGNVILSLLFVLFMYNECVEMMLYGDEYHKRDGLLLCHLHDRPST